MPENMKSEANFEEIDNKVKELIKEIKDVLENEESETSEMEIAVGRFEELKELWESNQELEEKGPAEDYETVIKLVEVAQEKVAEIKEEQEGVGKRETGVPSESAAA